MLEFRLEFQFANFDWNARQSQCFCYAFEQSSFNETNEREEESRGVEIGKLATKDWIARERNRERLVAFGRERKLISPLQAFCPVLITTSMNGRVEQRRGYTVFNATPLSERDTCPDEGEWLAGLDFQGIVIAASLFPRLSPLAQAYFLSFLYPLYSTFPSFLVVQKKTVDSLRRLVVASNGR